MGIVMSDGERRAAWAAAVARRLSFDADIEREGVASEPAACRLCIDLEARRRRSEGEGL